MNIFVVKNNNVRLSIMDGGISKELLLWYMRHKRELPWRNITDPYHIWVSEIILQQTRVAQGLAYYENFIKNFPTIKSLADATQEQILKIWQGLGYYSRARNMHTASKQIVEVHKSTFPTTYKELLTLKGVGEYTAAAVASLAYNEQVAVVDGNVIRVISRLFAVQGPVDKLSILKEIKGLASEILSIDKPALHNQAIMEFGALHCTPSNPNCLECPLSSKCLSYKYKIVAKVPCKTLKIKVRTRYFYYLVINVNNGLYFQKRGAGDIWEGLYEFPLIEKKEPVSPEKLPEEISKELSFWHSNVKILNISEPVKHVLTHQRLQVSFIYIKIKNLLTTTPIIWTWKKLDTIHKLAVPRVIDRYIHSPHFNKINENIL